MTKQSWMCGNDKAEMDVGNDKAELDVRNDKAENCGCAE